MKRRDILKTAGIAGLGSLIPFDTSKASKATLAKLNMKSKMAGNVCVLIPQETEGPYVFDLSNNPDMFRQDIRENNPGTQLNLKFTVVNINDNCSPIQNARVDIWHCNKDGYYSAFNNQSGYLGTQNHAGETFFRGIQMTDVDGVVDFVTIYPGWYPGRAAHIHFQVFLNSVLKATSQTAFSDAQTTAVNNTPLYSPHGQNPTKNSNDGVFSDLSNTAYELLTITDNASTGGFDGSLIVGIDAPSTGVINLEPETGGQFKLANIYPNPMVDSAVIPFNLTNAANVTLILFDLQGRKIGELYDGHLAAGDQKITLYKQNGKMTLSSGNYIYQFIVENSHGRFSQSRTVRIL